MNTNNINSSSCSNMNPNNSSSNNNGNSNSNNNANSASNILLAKQIRTDHNDLIQDISYDFFGRRVATASLDQLVKIWNVNENNDWELKDDIKVLTSFSSFYLNTEFIFF